MLNTTLPETEANHYYMIAKLRLLTEDGEQQQKMAMELDDSHYRYTDCIVPDRTIYNHHHAYREGGLIIVVTHLNQKLEFEYDDMLWSKLLASSNR